MMQEKDKYIFIDKDGEPLDQGSFVSEGEAVEYAKKSLVEWEVEYAIVYKVIFIDEVWS